MGLVSMVGLGLIIGGYTAPLGMQSRVFLEAFGAVLTLSALSLLVWDVLRQHRMARDLEILQALYGNSGKTTFLVEGWSNQILWTNAKATTEKDSTADRIDTLLASISAQPLTLAHRLYETALAQGAAHHSVMLADREWQATVRPAGQGRALWQIEEVRRSHPLDVLPFQLVLSDASGAIQYMSPEVAARSMPKARRLSDVFALPLPQPGLLASIVERSTGVRRKGVRLNAGDNSDSVILLGEEEAPNLGQSEFDAMQQLPVAIAVLDNDTRLAWFNDETRRLLRLTGDAHPRFAELLEGLGRPVGEWLADLQAGRITSATEVLRSVNQSEDRFLQVTLRPYSTSGELLAIMHDATEFKQLEAKFTQSQKMQAIGQLAGGIAHDFNNLLTAISGHCDLILLRHDRSDPHYPDLMQIQQNTNRAAALVRQLLAFSRKQTLQFETLDLHGLLADAIHLLNRLVGERVTLTLRYGADMPLIRSDKRQLEQVLMNLVVNARDAMPMGGEVVIETERCVLANGLSRDRATVPPGDYAIIRVRDEGIGMSSAIKAKAFDPFFSTKRQGEGTGLGLSTVYGIVKQSGGFIFLDSGEGEGTTFSIFFAAQPRIAKSESVEQEPKLLSNPASVARGTVLLVEDEAPVRSFAARALQLQGHRVLEADSGEAAMDILNDPNARPDVIVTDVIMPGLDGPAWVAQIRDRFVDTPVIFMSGYAEDSRVAAQASIGKAVFIGKPFSLAEFTQTVNEQLRLLSEAV